MKLAFSSFWLLILVACTTLESPQTPVVASTPVIPNHTFFAPSPLPSLISTIPSTPEIPCNPLDADFCVTDGYFFLQRPVQPPANDVIDTSYRYGSTANGTRDPHHGVEFANPSGTPVYAAGEGTVIFAGSDQEAGFSPWQNYYGNLVVIQHSDELLTLYAHLSQVDVRAGQKVSIADKLGEVGRTGVAIGSHLHFEVRRGNGQDYFATQNPELWLIPARDGDGNPLGAVMISLVDFNHALLTHAEFTIQYYSDISAPPVKSYYVSTYSPDMMNSEENAALGDLPAGKYRIAVDVNGRIHERWVEVQSGKLTQVVMIVN
jgi:murein DD-endopeptidase MepM/ murein hydrolase activator NlpD